MRIKVAIALVILCYSGLSVFAQYKSDRYHEFGSEKHLQFKIYGGPIISLLNVEQHFSLDFGATAGIMLTSKFFMGIYGQKLISGPQRTDLAVIGYPTYSGGEIKMMHAGGIMGLMSKPEKALHWGVSGTAGIGRIDLYAKDPVSLRNIDIYNDRVILLIPRVFFEANMTSWFKANVNAGFRLVAKVNAHYVNPLKEEIPIFKSSDYSKPEFSISLLFGNFGIYRGLLSR